MRRVRLAWLKQVQARAFSKRALCTCGEQGIHDIDDRHHEVAGQGIEDSL
jgi:hypothetical protein